MRPGRRVLSDGWRSPVKKPWRRSVRSGVRHDHGHDHGQTRKRIDASEFKAKCLHLMDEFERIGEPLVITKNGRPIAQLAPPGHCRRRHEGGGLETGERTAGIDDPVAEAFVPRGGADPPRRGS
jgi:prevent-host-death family protein